MLKNLEKQDLWLQNAVLATGYFGKARGRNILHILSLENHRNCIGGKFQTEEFIMVSGVVNLY